MRLSKRFSVSRSTVRRLIKIKKETGDIQPKPHAGGWMHLIQDSDLKMLSDLVAKKSDRTIKELIEQWLIMTGIKVSHATMVRALQRAKLTIKKRRLGRMNAIQRRTRKGVKSLKLSSDIPHLKSVSM